ncbi:ESX secretion-associated protein EspG [Nocardia alba]|uniref:ESAT-6 protein secretion system EspG family protein n=1 Tax=Nocardia alba TaxID=225051 RepID=A0A4R1FVG9_9NOCA|nr:ESX secretion-associated protein EspG [Nocardia alba]TCJ97759.1 ESAT-6 protein secretion system EspG family protein [Nocardia alba]
MSRTWHLTDVELIAAWDSLFKDRLPLPLFALHRGEDADGWQRLALAALDVLAETGDGALYAALNRVANADVVVTAEAFDPRDAGDPLRRVRVIAARQGEGATLIRQLPGETIWHSGGFTVSSGSGTRLAAAVVGALPFCAAGRGPRLVLSTAGRADGTDSPYRASRVYDSELDGERASATWLSQPVECLGMIETRLGASIFGPRGVRPYRIDWRDLVDDGRYAILTDDEQIATPVDRAHLAELIGADIATVEQTLEDERYV